MLAGNLALDIEVLAEEHGIVKLAEQFARRYHHGQFRHVPKNSRRKPYIIHPAGVVALLKEHGVTDPTTLAIGWLHDTIEDTPATYEGLRQVFGPKIAYGVYILTRDVSRADYIKRLESADDNIKLVKLCDTLDNLRTVECLGPSGIARKINDTEMYYIPMADKLCPQIASRLRRSLDVYFERLRYPV